MKMIVSLLSCCCWFIANAQLVDVTISGDQNLKVVINNIEYETGISRGSADSKHFTINNLRPGQYSMQLFRLDNIETSPDDQRGGALRRIVTPFLVRDGFEVSINVAPNGIVQVREKQVKGTTADPRAAVTEARFKAILRDINHHWRNTRKLAAIQSALQDNNNFFTAAQLSELLKQIPSEQDRLVLAKLGYPRLTDPPNFILIYRLLNEPASKSDLAAFMRSQGADITASFSESFRGPLNDASFEALLDRSRRNMDPSTRVNEVASIITNETQYFTVDQVRRLLELVDFETGRLQLLKAVYSQVTDPWNFPRLYSLLATDVAKLELVTHVRSAAENGGLVNYNLGKPATDEADFTKLINTTREKAEPVVYLTETFNENRYYFSAVQAVQLISLAEGEATRLALAKAAYRSIVDPENFLSVSLPLLQLPVSRNELLIYAYSFRKP